jgi:hypothetical protein
MLELTGDFNTRTGYNTTKENTGTLLNMIYVNNKER